MLETTWILDERFRGNNLRCTVLPWLLRRTDYRNWRQLRQWFSNFHARWPKKTVFKGWDTIDLQILFSLNSYKTTQLTIIRFASELQKLQSPKTKGPKYQDKNVTQNEGPGKMEGEKKTDMEDDLDKNINRFGDLQQLILFKQNLKACISCWYGLWV